MLKLFVCVFSACLFWNHIVEAQEIDVRAILDGKRLYEEYAGCASCHGADGRGEVEGLALDPPPPDLSDCSFNTREPRRDWRAVILHGGPARGLSMSMPAYSENLSEEQIAAIIDYIKTFCAERDVWPVGELNFRRAHVTSKAYPENEALLLPDFTRHSDNSAKAKFVYERRFGSKAHWEIAVPLEARWARPREQGFGNVELSAKYVLLHDTRTLTIVSGGLEVALPTGKSAAGIGEGAWKGSPYLAAGKGFPHFTLQSSVKLETPLQKDGETALFYNLAFTLPLTKDKKGLFPMLEANGVTNLENGASLLFLTPQLYLGLVKRGHVAVSVAGQFPVAGEKPFDYRLLGFLLWEYADGGLWW